MKHNKIPDLAALIREGGYIEHQHEGAMKLLNINRDDVVAIAVSGDVKGPYVYKSVSKKHKPRITIKFEQSVTLFIHGPNKNENVDHLFDCIKKSLH